MTNLTRGDVVLVPFGFTDRSGVKWRPAVVVSTDQYHQNSPDVLIASITGNLNALPHPGDHELVDWQSAGLLKPSLVQTKAATIETQLVGQTLGRLSAADLRALDQGLRLSFGL
jgi:mRNA interferase MazF